jgi:hypothetical protein
MKRNKQQSTNTAGPEEHLDTLGDLLTQLRTHLTSAAGKKGTYGDYLRLLDFYRETRGIQAKELTVYWVDNPELATRPSA